ncbi:MAG: F0F1 ATP synthase subunit B [Myxococcota bacterium]
MSRFVHRLTRAGSTRPLGADHRSISDLSRILSRGIALGTTLVMVALWPVLSLASPAEGGHGAEGAHGGEHAGGSIELISPVFGNTGKMGLLWTIINFAVLLWILNKLLFQPLIKRTRDKHDTVKSEIDKATAARTEAEGLLTEYKGRLERLDDEIEELMADAKKKAQADRTRIIEAAEREAEQIKAAAKASAEREANARRRQLEAEIVDRAVERAEAIIREKITPADQRSMVDRYVTQLGHVDFGGR